MGKFTYEAHAAECDYCGQDALDFNPDIFFDIVDGWIEEDNSLGHLWTFCCDDCRELFYEQLYLR